MINIAISPGIYTHQYSGGGRAGSRGGRGCGKTGRHAHCQYHGTDQVGYCD